MHVAILSLASDTRTSDIAQALKFCHATCSMISLPLNNIFIPADAVMLLLDTPHRTAPLLLQELRRQAPTCPVLVLSAVESRTYSARLIAYGATVVLPPESELESICAEASAVHLIQKYSSGEPPLRSLQPFIAGVIESFEMMASIHVKLDVVGHCDHSEMPGNVSALIYLIGSRERVLTLNCTDVVANNFAKKILPDAIDEPELSMVDDALGEMLNIIAGLVRSRQRAETGDQFEITTPTIVRGDNHRLSLRADLPGFEMCFSSKEGAFVLRLGHRAWGA